MAVELLFYCHNVHRVHLVSPINTQVSKSSAISDTTAIRTVMSSGFPPVMLKPSHLACSENGEEKVGSNE